MIIVVFNICGISGQDHVADYIPRIEALLNQMGVNARVVVSSCRTPAEHLARLRAHFGDRVSWWATEQTLPVNITFNRAAERAALEFDLPEGGYVYVDSGCLCEPGVLEKLSNNSYMNRRDRPVEWHCLRSAHTDSDTGFRLWFPGVPQGELLKDDIFTVPLGKTVNLHVLWFDPAIAKTFGHLIPDVFARYCTESTFSFVAAAMGGWLGFWRDARVSHWHGMDVGSSGFPAGPCDWDQLLPEAPRSMKEIIADPEAWACGFGYEECQKIFPHNPAAYCDERGSRDPKRLQRFIQANIYLPKERFDYNAIEESWVR